MRGIFLITGANLGDRQASLSMALDQLGENCGSIVNRSDLFETAAWGKTDQPAFLNQAIELASELPAPVLMENILAIEERMGRKRAEKYGARLIDIDIIFFGNAIINLRKLSVPHPHMHNRRFVLAPLNQIAPEFIHPVLNKTVSTLLDECDDPLEVNLFERTAGH